jgi:hypothetical protein
MAHIVTKTKLGISDELLHHLAGTENEFRSASGYIAGGAEVKDDAGNVRGVIAYLPGVKLASVLNHRPLGTVSRDA